MSVDTKAGQGQSADMSAQSAGGQDLGNLKAEVNRKLSNVDSKLQELARNNEQLMQVLQSIAPPKQAPASPTQKLDDVWFESPTKAAETVISEAEKRIEAKLTARAQAEAKQSQTIASLVADFPELQDSGHELTQKAVEIFEKFAPEDKTSPLAYKAAVKEAALELGYMPKSKRDMYEEDTTVRGGGNSTARTRQQQQRKTDIDPATEEFAERVGVNIKDPQVRERIKNKHGRRSYTRFE